MRVGEKRLEEIGREGNYASFPCRNRREEKRGERILEKRQRARERVEKKRVDKVREERRRHVFWETKGRDGTHTHIRNAIMEEEKRAVHFFFSAALLPITVRQ